MAETNQSNSLPSEHQGHGANGETSPQNSNGQAPSGPDNQDLYGAPKDAEELPGYEAVISVPDYDSLPPPPSYEPPKLEGASSPSDDSSKNAPTLVYTDFLPRILPDKLDQDSSIPVFEGFQTLMTIVNDWIRNNPHYKVIQVTDLERKLNPNTWALETETTVRTDHGNGQNHCVRGVRLWLTANENRDPPQEIWYMNVVPKAENDNPGTEGLLYFPKFEDMDTTIEKLNKHLQDNPLQGRVLSIASCIVRYTNTYGKDFNPDAGLWTDKPGYKKLFLTLLRIFFIRGSPQPVKIGIQTIVPTILSVSSIQSKEKLEDFQSVMQRGSAWLKEQKGIRFTNAQTVQSVVSCKPILRETTIDSSSMFFISWQGEMTFTQTLRLCYVIDPSGSSSMPNLTKRDFCPIKTGRIMAEPTSVVAARISNWLAHTKGKVIGVDTLLFPYPPGSKTSVRTNDSKKNLMKFFGSTDITCFRVYLDGDFPEPPPNVRPPTPSVTREYARSDEEMESEFCTLL